MTDISAGGEGTVFKLWQCMLPKQRCSFRRLQKAFENSVVQRSPEKVKVSKFEESQSRGSDLNKDNITVACQEFQSRGK